MKGIVLFGHGARDIRWREPFDRLCSMWRDQHPDQPVATAFLELMEPTLTEAVKQMEVMGVSEVLVLPVFMGQGGHLRNDLPRLMEDCQKMFPDIRLSTTHAIGEDVAVLQAVIDLGARFI